MSWKMPVPTDLNKFFGNDYLSWLLYVVLLMRARIEDGSIEFAGIPTFLTRGQSVCGYRELAEIFHRDFKTIEKHLKKLQNVYMKVELKTTSKGTIVTIKNFDEVINMERKVELSMVRNKIDKSINNNLGKTSPYKEESFIEGRKIW